MSKSKSRPAADMGTPQLASRHHLKPELVSQSAGFAIRMKVTDQKEIDKLLFEERITLEEHHIANDFLRDLQPVSSYPSLNLDRVHCSTEQKDGSPSWAKAIHKLNYIYRHMDEDIGQDARKLAVMVLAQDYIIRHKEDHTDLELFRASLTSYQGIISAWRR